MQILHEKFGRQLEPSLLNKNIAEVGLSLLNGRSNLVYTAGSHRCYFIAYYSLFHLTNNIKATIVTGFTNYSNPGADELHSYKLRTDRQLCY